MTVSFTTKYLKKKIKRGRSDLTLASLCLPRNVQKRVKLPSLKTIKQMQFIHVLVKTSTFY